MIAPVAAGMSLERRYVVVNDRIELWTDQNREVREGQEEPHEIHTVVRITEEVKLNQIQNCAKCVGECKIH